VAIIKSKGGDCWHYELGVVLDGNLPDELSLMTTYFMHGNLIHNLFLDENILVKGIKKICL